IHSLLIILRPPSSTLFPYTTLFRSHPLPEVLGRLGKGPDPLDDLHDRVAELLHLDAELRGIPGVHADLLDIPVLLRDLRLDPVRSEEHTSELQSRENLVCRLLLEKK